MKRMLLAMLATIGLMGQAVAQEDLVDAVMNACATDINSYCPQVTPGQGRILHCMAAHEDKISGQCQYALYQAATVIEQLAAATAYLIDQCGADAEKHCSAVAMGEGRILACLDDNADDVSAACKTAISDTIGE